RRNPGWRTGLAQTPSTGLPVAASRTTVVTTADRWRTTRARTVRPATTVTVLVAGRNRSVVGVTDTSAGPITTPVSTTTPEPLLHSNNGPADAQKSAMARPVRASTATTRMSPAGSRRSDTTVS